MEDVRYTLTFEGISALVMNSNAALLGGGEDKGRDPAKYELEHFREKAYTTADGELMIPARAIKKMAIDACKFYPKKPKGTNFKSFGPFIQAATIVPADAALGVTTTALRPLTLVVNLDPTKGSKGPRGPRTRPMLPPVWNATAELIVFDPILTKDHLAEIFERAGKQVGVLDGRAVDFGRCLISLKAQ
jgi:hypothetical protein